MNLHGGSELDLSVFLISDFIMKKYLYVYNIPTRDVRAMWGAKKWHLSQHFF